MLNVLKCSSTLTAEYNPSNQQRQSDIEWLYRDFLKNKQKNNTEITKEEKTALENTKFELRELLTNVNRTGLKKVFQQVLTGDPEKFKKLFTPDILNAIASEQLKYSDRYSPFEARQDEPKFEKVLLQKYDDRNQKEILITSYSFLTGMLQNADAIERQLKSQKDINNLKENVATLSKNITAAFKN
jgi:tagatose-1,6-bisphosphate aldolase non-catalytic subunit AgaZ/GatZ